MGKDTKKKENVSKEPSDDEKRRLLQLSEISLWMDDYDEIFSDFDPRPFSERALSDDFLAEAKKAARDKAFGKIELKFLVPQDKRNLNDEVLVKKRLKEHFKKHYSIIQRQQKDVIRLGAGFITLGVIVMFTAAFILFNEYERSFLINLILVILEPGGWFLFWEGLGQVIFEARKQKPELDFYKKMSKANIEFISY